MSNHLAAAAVTATLRRVLQGVLDAEAGDLSARVTHVRPGAPAADLPAPGINIFLYQVTANAAARNADLPTRRSDGTLSQRPTVALDLHYVLTFHGEDARLEPQIILGVVARALHARPVIARADIEAMRADATFDFVADTDLADDLEVARIVPESLTLEQVANLWSAFQTSYVLWMTYVVSVVRIEATDQVRSAPLPVREAVSRALPARAPTIERVLARTSAAAPALDQPILAGFQLVLEGSQLAGDVTRVRFDGGSLLTPAIIGDTAIEIELPSTLLAGPHRVQVVHLAQLGATADTARPMMASPEADLVLRPAVTATAPGAGSLGVTIAPGVDRRQRVALLLNQLGAPSGTTPAAYRFEAPGRSADGVTSLAFDVSAVPAGSWLVRVEVDGTQSVVTSSVDGGPYDVPAVSL